jgi:hypothetical protein
MCQLKLKSEPFEAEIERELLREKEIVGNKDLPISGYNYSALRDRLKKNGIKVSVNTIIDRAKHLDCYIPVLAAGSVCEMLPVEISNGWIVRS